MPTLDPSKTIKPADPLVTARAGMVLPMADFIERCVDAGHMTLAEAAGLARKTGLPTWAVTALQQAFPNAQARAKAELRIWATDRVSRSNPIVRVMQAAKALTDEQVDAIFTGAP